MKIIFLDIDGVLNHQLHYKEKRQTDRYKEEGRYYLIFGMKLK